MTAEEQIKEIVKILAPEDPNQKDAVFLLMHRLTRDTQEIQRLRKQRDLLEAEVSDLRKTAKELRPKVVNETECPDCDKPVGNGPMFSKKEEKAEPQVQRETPTAKGKTL